ncbi:hypothetical protein WCX49_05655 [Sulfurimonas sp. HSL-1656]|uniref:Uncharacterized protein n=1 Tax=Sulfurimonas diazotrophicus TaxID=3131939 RepID=A0ABZ3HCC1_9BACT|nr:hypothetical protein [Sulfurimonas sp. HSL-3221]UFS63632.1 hypothetical protein LOH54_05735 [Sulfurimonas sp. HSL-3221]
MADKPLSELDEREPELDESSDYEKPLSSNKRTWILSAFAIAIIVYLLYNILMSSF